MAIRLPRSFRSPTAIKTFATFVGLFIFWQYFTSGSWLFSPRTVVPILSYENQTLPPIYPALKEMERKLPQHQENLKFPEGKNGTWGCLSCWTGLRVLSMTFDIDVFHREIPPVWKSALGVCLHMQYSLKLADAKVFHSVGLNNQLQETYVLIPRLTPNMLST